ncbi:MAG TPA: tRNA dihydrouridine(20/20a) synthase DusA [Gammaproteobacteria bacterium]|nr:tRNA dihydrouridine(20/20a) synthase DusA [Gammaproteobacteria bacterium]
MKISVAPMMDCTDRHDRYFLRLIAPDVLLYTEMITAAAIMHGDKNYLLGYDNAEHPVALQLGGSDPRMLAESAAIGEDFGYDEINLNCGCPSPRVSSGRFGACLMYEPELVAECVAAMRDKVNIPVTVKCRIGVDDQDSYDHLCCFISTVATAGCDTFIVHARKAWLKGLSPKQNRQIPPLRYDVVRQIKQDFPHLKIMLNGGITSVSEIKNHLQWADGVMIGRAAYSNPYLLAEIQRDIFTASSIPSRRQIIDQFIPYVERQLISGVRLTSITRHILGLFQNMPGAASWRRYLSQNAYKKNADVNVIREALSSVD